MDDADLVWLRRRAKRVYGGNLSAAVAEAARMLRKQEALRSFLDKEHVAKLSAAELSEIQNEWRGPARRARGARKKRAS